MRSLLLSLAWLLCSTACTTTHFLTQAAMGQLELATSARPIDEVIADPATDERTRGLLREVLRIKDYGTTHGLEMHENYREFVQLDRPFVVWFVNASAPLAFYPKTFWFPIVGSFPGLSWFDRDDANEFADELRQEGWDVNVRGVTAFSTGGWFDDPIVSSMLLEHPAALGFLVNTLLHESLHATVLVPDQQYFNESLASFVANQLTPPYLAERFGTSAPELLEYLAAIHRGEQNFELMAQANTELSALYMTALPPDEKLARKRAILDELARKVPFETPPNNATLIGVQLYNEGKAEMQELFLRCGTWQRFIAATGSLRTHHFGAPQSPQIGPALKELSARGCEPFPVAEPKLWGRALQQRRARDAQRKTSPQ